MSKNLINTIDQRYGVSISDINPSNGKKGIEVQVVRDLLKSPESPKGMSDSVSFKFNPVPIESFQNEKRFIESVWVDLDRITSDSDIYRNTDTGYNTMYHPKKSMWDKSLFHPLIYVEYKTKMLWFRLDNPLIGDMFMETQHHLQGSSPYDEDYTDFIIKEIQEYLDYCIDGKVDEWLKIYFEKMDNDSRMMLHKDYLNK